MSRASNARRRASWWGTDRSPAPSQDEVVDTSEGDLADNSHTFSDLCRYARVAVARTGPMAYSGMERYQEALSAIGEHASANPDADAHDLIAAGRDAIWLAGKEYRRHHGYSSHVERPKPEASPAFVAYWTEMRHAPSPEGGVVERLALAQILPTLTPRQRQVVEALALHDDHEAAREMLGLSVGSFSSYLSAARHRFLAWWHEGETPSRPWGHDRRGRHRVRAIVRRRANQGISERETTREAGRATLPVRARASDREQCPRGHRYDRANTYLTKQGHRKCRRCTLDRQAASRRSAAERRWRDGGR